MLVKPRLKGFDAFEDEQRSAVARRLGDCRKAVNLGARFTAQLTSRNSLPVRAHSEIVKLSFSYAPTRKTVHKTSSVLKAAESATRTRTHTRTQTQTRHLIDLHLSVIFFSTVDTRLCK